MERIKSGSLAAWYWPTYASKTAGAIFISTGVVICALNCDAISAIRNSEATMLMRFILCSGTLRIGMFNHRQNKYLGKEGSGADHIDVSRSRNPRANRI